MPKWNMRVERVIDGDTLIATIWQHVDTDIAVQFGNQRIRLLGCNCPEANTLEGPAATRATMKWLAAQNSLIAETVGRDNFGRLLGHVHGDKESLSVHLLQLGLATPYRTRGTPRWLVAYMDRAEIALYETEVEADAAMSPNALKAMICT
jgi:endonuclease YncB( thermonuclease family)